MFLGVCVYFESLVAEIRALFWTNWTTRYSTKSLLRYRMSHFTSPTEVLKFSMAETIFKRDALSVVTDRCRLQLNRPSVSVSMSCASSSTGSRLHSAYDHTSDIEQHSALKGRRCRTNDKLTRSTA